jgi:hypothetical protein
MKDINLISLRKISRFKLPEIKNQIKNNLAGNRLSDRFAYAWNRKNTKAQYWAFGRAMADCIRDEDVSEALDLINRSDVNCRNGWHSFMEDKFSDNFFHCQDCENLFSTDEEHNCYDDYSVCNSCADHNYHYSDRNSYWVRDDDEDESEDQNIREYHTCSDHLGHIPSKYDARKPRVLLGLELEMEIKDSYCRDDRAGELLKNVGEYKNHTYALCENDGSLNHGFEMVTAYTGLDVHSDQLQYFANGGLKGAISHDSDSCGLHVHICKADMTTLHGAKMILFINDQANHKLIKAIARRDSSEYAKIKNKKDDTYWLKDAVRGCDTKRSQLRSLNADRYEALNFKNTNTVEFRLFKGSLVYSTIMSCLEFTYATWFFTRESSTKNLTTDHFLKFICANENRADTKNLRAYLKAKGFVLPEKSSVVPFPNQFPNQSPNQLKKVA